MSHPLPIGLYFPDRLNRAGFEHLVAEKIVKVRDRRQIMRAYRISKHGHKGVPRRDGDRFFEHPKAVAALLFRLSVTDSDEICAALFHDTPEDTFILEFDDIRDWWGRRVYRIVQLVTKSPGMSESEYYARLRHAGEPGSWFGKLVRRIYVVRVLLGYEPGALLIKCADRLHNLTTLVSSDDPALINECRQKKIEQVEETRRYILPLAVLLAQCPGYESVGEWFVTQITAWCNRREQEVEAAPRS